MSTVKAGFNDFFFTCTHLGTSGSSGSMVLYSASGSFQVASYCNGVSGNTGNVYAVPNVDVGTYRLNMYTGVGNGFAKVTNNEVGVVLTPNEFRWEATVNSLDDVAQLVAVYRNAVAVNPLGTEYYEIQQVGIKESDNIDMTYIIPSAVTPSLSGWSNFICNIRSEVASISSGTTILGALTVIPNYLTSSVQITGASSYFTGLIPYPRRSVKAYADLVAKNHDGLTMTLAEFDFTVNRRY
jgi:hypothetical protein